MRSVAWPLRQQTMPSKERCIVKGEIEMCRNRNDIKKFIKNVKCLTEGFKPGASFYRNECGNLVTQGVLNLWMHHFSRQFQGGDGTNSASRVNSEPAPIDDDDVKILSPNHDEVRIMIQRLQMNKVRDQMASLLSCLRPKPMSWYGTYTSSPVEYCWWQASPAICAKYRCISHLLVAYKVISRVLCQILKPQAKALIEVYQCGFKPGNSTTDQIFTLRQILKKTHENHVLIDFKAEFDNPVTYRVYV